MGYDTQATQAHLVNLLKRTSDKAEAALDAGDEVEAKRLLTEEEICDAWERVTGHSIFGGDSSDGRAMYISRDEVLEFARIVEGGIGAEHDAR